MTELDDRPAAEEKRQSFLVADCGSVNTTVALFDAAVDSYFLIARATVGSTIGEPWNDLTLGLRQAITQLTEMVGRSLLSKKGNVIKPARADGTGVDHFAITVSAAAPLETIIVGLFDEVSLSSARRALDNVYYHEADSLSLGDGRSEKEQVAAFLKKQPDLVFIAGGTDGGAEDRLLQLVEIAALGVKALSETKLSRVLYAGNKQLREQVRAIIGDKAQLLVADNVRPDLEGENLDDAIKAVTTLYDAKIAALPGIDAVNEWSDYDAQPTAQAFAAVVDYFAALYKGRIVGIDLGAGSSTLVMADPDQRDLAVNTGLGMGRPIANLRAKVSSEDIARWLPIDIEETEIRNFLYNKALYPQTVPMTEADLYLSQAAAREIMRCLTVESALKWGQSDDGQMPPFDLLLARGSALTNAPRPGQAVLMLLDALQPTGIFSVVLDRHGVLPALGLLALNDPLAAVQILAGSALDNLGWVIVPMGKGQPGQTVLTVIMESDMDTHLEVEVEYGSIETIPVTPGERSDVTLKPARRFDIGFGPGQGKKITLRSGSVGLIVDARGRPLTTPSEPTERQEKIRQWLWGMGG